MELGTQEHLDTAERNRDLARALLNPTVAPGLATLPYEWVAVIAFYAAVHFVNAYLWERYRVAPRNHTERGNYVRHDPVLRRCANAYGRLLDTGYKARYLRRYRVAASWADQLVNVDLADVEAAVRAAL